MTRSPGPRASIAQAIVLGSIVIAMSACGSAPPSPPPAGAAGPPGAVAGSAWAATGSMAVVRYRHTATLLANGRVLVAGGYTEVTGSDPLASAELYDPVTGSWTATGAMHIGRQGHSATLLPNGKVLVVGGGSTSSVREALTSAELYDPVTGAWTATGSLHEARLGSPAILLPTGKVLVVGGSAFSIGSSLHALATAELYNPASGVWTAAGTISGVRYLASATLLPDGMVLAAGGITDKGPLSTADLFDPTKGSWAATGNLIAGRAGQTATLLADGKVLVAGGGNTPASAELYDPGSRSWTATGDMHEGRQGQVATLLPNGKVLVTGGGFSAAADLYDPASKSWTATGTMVAARVNQTATLLPNGKVVVTGGDSLTGKLASAELYTP